MLALFIAIAIWGSSLPIGKLAYHSFEPVILVQFRFCIAAFIVLPTFMRCYRHIASHHYKQLIWLSFLNYPVVFLLQFIGLKIHFCFQCSNNARFTTLDYGICRRSLL